MPNLRIGVFEVDGSILDMIEEHVFMDSCELIDELHEVASKRLTEIRREAQEAKDAS